MVTSTLAIKAALSRLAAVRVAIWIMAMAP
jgi:hypothetical protein